MIWIATGLSLWLGLGAVSAHASGRVALVSDLDDTIKITDVADPVDAFVHSTFRTDSFAGMSELYSAAASPLFVVSGSPPILRFRVKAFLKKNGFHAAGIYLQSWLKEHDLIRYKSDALRNVLTRTDLPLILVGDDTQSDPEIYAEFAQAHPERVAAIYIHRITGRPLLDGEIPFVTAFDMAYAENQAGRLDEGSAIRVGDAILRARKAERVLAHYAQCPPDLSAPIPENTDLDLVHEAIQKELERICSRPHRDDDDPAPGALRAP